MYSEKRDAVGGKCSSYFIKLNENSAVKLKGGVKILKEVLF